jgi:hypothetical protein
MILWRWSEELNEWQALTLEAGKPCSLSDDCQLQPLAQRNCSLLVRGHSHVRVNGIAPLPLRVLEDRDEICVAGEAFYFSIESAPEIVYFSVQDKEFYCARCKGKLEEGTLSVKCPRCSAYHHESEGLCCWSYGDRCSANCAQPTAGYSWQPEPLHKKRAKNGEPIRAH